MHNLEPDLEYRNCSNRISIPHSILAKSPTNNSRKNYTLSNLFGPLLSLEKCNSENFCDEHENYHDITCTLDNDICFLISTVPYNTIEYFIGQNTKTHTKIRHKNGYMFHWC